MNSPVLLPGSSAICQLRADHYNARVTEVVQPHDELRLLRVVPDAGVPAFLPGQYASLGLGNWEPRVAGVDEEHLDAVHQQRMSLRAYSISCSILDGQGQLRRPADFPYLEFYVTLVRHAARRPPALTPRLFALHAGDRIYVGQNPAGHYTLAAVGAHQDVFFFATGTGEAPHNAMLAELLAGGHRGRITSAVCLRRRADAAYRAVHEELMRRYPQYRYVVLTTREPENLDAAHPQYAGKQYLQDLVRSGSLERLAGVPLSPENAHAFLCGSPQMIGAIGHVGAGLAAEPGSMLDLLLNRGFCAAAGDQPGNLHFERYW